MKESTARIGDGRRDTTTTMIGLEVNAFRAVGRKSIKNIKLTPGNGTLLKQTNDFLCFIETIETPLEQFLIVLQYFSTIAIMLEKCLKCCIEKLSITKCLARNLFKVPWNILIL